MKSKDANFLDSLLQQFKFTEAEEAAPADNNEDAEAGEEKEGESEEDQQPEQKEAKDSEGEEEETELPMVTPSRKGKEKLLEQEELEKEWEEDVDAAIE